MKRLLDLLVVAATTPMWAPALLIVAIAVRWRLGSPVLFVQERPGLGGQMFFLVKFRTLAPPPAGDATTPSDAERMTALGQWLRATSLDELPELWNVLRGHMSLVGPRPLLPDYLSLYTREQARRHEVRPGITGWAQVHGRNALSWEERFELDVWYVEHQSLWLDFKILLLTVVTVFRREGISQPGHATMEKFRGTQA